MDFLDEIRQSQLYNILSKDEELLNAVMLLRTNATKLAATIDRAVPCFTDHSIRHMDALWKVTSCVLTTSEIEKFTTAEAFLLASAFYLHDIGMAYAATSEGLKSLQESSHWRTYIASLPENERGGADAQARALSISVRAIHASAANELATKCIPGTDTFLIEPKIIRDNWGVDCGRIAASHHWSLEKLDHEFGRLQQTSLPGGRTGDLGYVACILRIVDFAHINRDRAPRTDRDFRQPLESDSLVHWLAQESIDGPDRDTNSLQYRSSEKIKNVDAWWLYYDLMRGLDAEIRSVKRYLDRRTSSSGRFSLDGVRGAESPDAASTFIPTTGFLPIEVNVRAGSITKLVELLAGESLYGPDPLAAVRELIQNARDAIGVKAAIATSTYDKATIDLPIEVTLIPGDQTRLEIVDYGVGMSQKVISDFLIAIASDYWTSQFHIDYPGAANFKPAGKFGIGFLSVFMLGDTVEVESNRAGESRYGLTLSGLGRRGELRPLGQTSGSGTRVSIKLKPSVIDALNDLGEMIRIYAPMLNHSIKIYDGTKATDIEKGWVSTLNATDFHSWLRNALTKLRANRSPRIAKRDLDAHEQYSFYLNHRYSRNKDAAVWGSNWPEYNAHGIRLLASSVGESLLCLKGLALQPIQTRGFSGIIDVDSVTPDASRRQALDADVTSILEEARIAVLPLIVENLNALGAKEFVITKLNFLSFCVSAYGPETLMQSSVPWISHVKVPGDLKQISCSELLTILSAKKSVFLVYNTGPWTAIKKWSESQDHMDDEDIVVLDGDNDSNRPGYVSGSEEKIGTLSELWPSCEKSELFGTILSVIAGSWQINIEQLTSQDGWTHGGSVVWGRIIRH